MFDLFITLEEIRNGIGNDCRVFASPTKTGLLVQVDWFILLDNRQFRFQHLFSKSEMTSIPDEFLTQYIIRKAKEQYNEQAINMVTK